MFEPPIVFLVCVIMLSVIMFLYVHDYDDAGLVGLTVLAIYSIITLIVTIMNAPADEVATIYECPCKVQELVVDQITHYHKTTGDTTATTYLDLSKCQVVKTE